MVVVFYHHDDFAAGAVDVLAVECEDKAGRLAPRGSHLVDAILRHRLSPILRATSFTSRPDAVASCIKTKTTFEWDRLNTLAAKGYTVQTSPPAHFPGSPPTLWNQTPSSDVATS